MTNGCLKTMVKFVIEKCEENNLKELYTASKGQCLFYLVEKNSRKTEVYLINYNNHSYSNIITQTIMQ